MGGDVKPIWLVVKEPQVSVSLSVGVGILFCLVGCCGFEFVVLTDRSSNHMVRETSYPYC